MKMTPKMKMTSKNKTNKRSEDDLNKEDDPKIYLDGFCVTSQLGDALTTGPFWPFFKNGGVGGRGAGITYISRLNGGGTNIFTKGKESLYVGNL